MAAAAQEAQEARAAEAKAGQEEAAKAWEAAWAAAAPIKPQLAKVLLQADEQEKEALEEEQRSPNLLEPHLQEAGLQQPP